MGGAASPGARFVGCADTTRGSEFSHQRNSAAARIHWRSRTVKQAAARANTRLGLLDSATAQAIDAAAADVAAGRHDEHFPIDIFQTGSGTSTKHECQRGDLPHWPRGGWGSSCMPTIMSTCVRAATTRSDSHPRQRRFECEAGTGAGARNICAMCCVRKSVRLGTSSRRAGRI